MNTRRLPGRRLTLAQYDARVDPGTPVQESFDALGESLSEATFVVVDLETTGTSPHTDRITEIGAVKVRGGEVIGEFATLINPGIAVPPQITVLTGITTSMVLQAPTIESVLPSFAEFAAGAILVAHNARFDLGFLRAAAKELQLPWHPRQHVDTLALARRIISRDEVRNYRLASLARLFQTQVEPNHRALSDARATVDVFHGLLSRLGSLGVTHVADLATAADPVPPARRRKVSLAEALPQRPGVYLFKGPGGELLYVGTAKNLRRRVRSYFTSAPDRKRIGEMVDLASTVEIIECPTTIEAQVRELRLIQEQQPAYNRRSKRAGREPWLRLTSERLPRLSIVRQPPKDGAVIGLFTSSRQARDAQASLEELGVRACTQRLPLHISKTAKACPLAEIGKCLAPCVNEDSMPEYELLVHSLIEAVHTDLRTPVTALRRRMEALALASRYEEAAIVRDRLFALLRGIQTFQELSPWWGSPLTIGARWSTSLYPAGAWELLVVKYGRLAASSVCPPGREPVQFAHDLAAASAHVDPPQRLGGRATREETTLVARWFETPGTRLIHHEGVPIAWPIHGAKSMLAELTPSVDARSVAS